MNNPSRTLLSAAALATFAALCTWPGGDVQAQANPAYGKQDDARDVNKTIALANAGDAQAQYRLGWMYDLGKGVPKDGQQAMLWYGKAAALGNADAHFNLGRMYELGRGIEKNEQLALDWYQKAAAQGLADAQNNLGLMYLDGRGVAKDGQQAYFWVLLAAYRGDPSAKSNLATLEKTLTAAQKSKIDANVKAWKPVTQP